MPNRCPDEEMSWNKDPASGSLDNKHLYVCHAEMNAITNTTKAELKGATLYVTLFPCNECAKIIIQSGIAKVGSRKY